MAHLEEKTTNEEEGVNGEDPDGIEGTTEEFILCLARAVKDAQQMEKCWYHCDGPDLFVCDCPQLAEMKADAPLNQKDEDSTKEGRPSPSRKDSHALKVPQDGMPKA